MSFSSVDGGGFAAPRPKPAAPSASGGGIFAGLGTALKPTITAINNSAPISTKPIDFGNPAGNYDPNPTIPFAPAPVIPAYTPGPIGASDGGAAAFTPPPADTPVDLGGVSPATASSGSFAPPTFDFGSQAASSAPASMDIGTLTQQALQNLGFSQIDSGLEKARNDLLVRYGDPALAGLAGFGLDPQAADFAHQNYVSGNADLARLDKDRELRKKAVIDRLASHGILNSGDLGYGLSDAESQYGNQRYDLQQNYLKQLSDLLSNSLTQKQGLRQNVVNALLQSFGNMIQDPAQLVGLYGG